MVLLAAATHVVRHQSELGTWESVWRPPDPRLREHLRGDYQGWIERTPLPLRRREPANAIVPLILDLGRGFRLYDADGVAADHHSFVAGLHDRHSFAESPGSADCIQVNMTPLGAHRILGLPLSEIAGQVVALDDLLGAAASRLVERLGQSGDWPERFAILEAFLLARLEAGRPAAPGVAWAWHRLHETAGSVAIGSLVAEVGWSHKHFIARFRDQIGLAPKTLARLLRFDRVVGLLDASTRAGGPAGWAEIALDGGYYDQAHLSRDFVEFTGLPPAEFLRRRVLDGGVVEA